MRFVYEYVGNSKRLALPCCVYDKIRGTFPEDTLDDYTGFELEPDEDDESEYEECSEDEHQNEQLQ